MTRECVVLPLINDGPCYQNDVEECEGDNCDGFGYSPSTNEYKVIRIYKDEVYVYTLGDGKRWRNIGIKESKSGIGKYIHSAYNNLDKDRNLVSFDLEDEKFGVLLSPPCFRDWKDYYYKLREIGERLSIFHENHDVYDIWLLKKKKNEKGYQSWTWIKEYTLNDDRDASQKKFNYGIPNPFAITKDREVLFNDDRFFYRHDLKTSTSYPLVGLKMCIPWSIYRTVHHVNSFVSLKALGERDTTTTIQNIVVDKSLSPELTYNIEEEEKTTICSEKTRERTDELDWFF
ncbi:uncharacterized protein LOC113316596 [Papaver somniferum]|uniref:uncharacterized protein LOC113316596 n=1 Tax=Papaver somniferum TaxID=3469 RepID=UPI000E700F87|nr:uncharacterized protein LOC113316596 [Papaver somniferum]